jgi:hypothetical protein
VASRTSWNSLVSDVLDDGLVGGLHLLELGDDIVKLNQQLTVLLFGAVAIERPAILFQEVLEGAPPGAVDARLRLLPHTSRAGHHRRRHVDSFGNKGTPARLVRSRNLKQAFSVSVSFFSLRS